MCNDEMSCWKEYSLSYSLILSRRLRFQDVRVARSLHGWKVAVGQVMGKRAHGILLNIKITRVLPEETFKFLQPANCCSIVWLLSEWLSGLKLVFTSISCFLLILYMYLWLNHCTKWSAQFVNRDKFHVILRNKICKLN